MKQERINLPPLSLEHQGAEVIIRHESGLTSRVSESRLAQWCMGLLRKELMLKPELSDAQVAAVDSQVGKL